MLVARASLIKDIDKYMCEVRGIPAVELMHRSGVALERVLRSVCLPGSRVVILCGSGNNGGDGYALATLLSDYDTVLLDVFDKGQRSDEGKRFRDAYLSSGKDIYTFRDCAKCREAIASADCIVDAIFGVGFKGEYPSILVSLSDMIKSSKAKKIAVDIPLGINADTGAVDISVAYKADITVCLSLLKAGLISQPGREYSGRVVLDTIGIDIPDLKENFDFDTFYIDEEYAVSHLPIREANSSKGSFGKLGMITGSDKYMGAAHLSLEAALRGGVGYVSFFGTYDLCRELRMKYPEVIYNGDFSFEKIIPENFEKMSAILVGSGVGTSREMFELVSRLLLTEGAPLVLDADALNSVAVFSDLCLFRKAKRNVIVTPHPLEFARLMKTEVSAVQSDRIKYAFDFCEQVANKVILVLKGSSTLVTDGKMLLINSSGSSALAKAGTGDVLAGLLSSLVASGCDPLSASALAVYYHGLAADKLEKELSPIGVLPSELPRKIASVIAEDYLK